NSGLMYFQLAANYGDNRAGVPLVTRDNMDDPNPTPRAENVTVNYNYIISELKNAAIHLPYFENQTSDLYGRPHKVAAWGYLAKTYLYMKKYDSSAIYADSIITFGKRELLPNFADVFKAENNYSKEFVWSAYASAISGGWGSILPGVMLENKGWGKYNGWGYYTPTKELYDAFVSGDLRRDATILKPGDHFTYFGQDVVYSSLNSLSGYQFRKYMDPFKYANAINNTISSNGDNPTTNLNVPLMRFAEVLLMKAEDAIMLRGAGAGDIELNKIRVRAGLPEKSGMTIIDLKRERRCELAGEFADRHRDLVRWGDAQAAYAQPAHGYSGKEVWPARKFDPIVNAVWAVPQREIDNSGGIVKQNAGW
ncbi:MAG: RagB/SusD family nutrient uptake outer membrane protein, partial [Pseudopedobacter saltans]